jgi:hypothetical protein
VVRRDDELMNGFKAKLSLHSRPWKEADLDKAFVKPKLRAARRAQLLSSGPALTKADKDAIAGEMWWDLVFDATTGLTAAGYNVRSPPAGHSNSYDKFIGYDKNFAYAWFFRHVVGIPYFSKTWKWGCAANSMNEHNLAQRTLESTVPLSEAGKLSANDGGFVHHDPDERKKEDASFAPSDALFGKNALGFQTATGFVRGLGDTSKPDVDKCSWADVYYYREPDAPNPPRNFGI